jgi:serine/threonine protein kinase
MLQTINASNDANCYKNIKVNRSIGEGSQGVVYALKGNTSDERVLKISEYDTPKKLENMKNEVIIGTILGDIGIAPKLYEAWICKDKVYILMERIKGSLRDIISGKESLGVYYEVDHINKIPKSLMNDYIDAFAKITEMGYIHMDSHPANLGIINRNGKDRGILIDFGFTVKRTDLDNFINKELAFGFSLGQIMEHAPLVEITTSVMFAKMKQIYNDLNMSIKFNELPTSSIDEIIKNMPTTKGLPIDLYVGFVLYCKILQLDQELRYQDPNFITLYYIRQSRFNPEDPTSPLFALNPVFEGGNRRHRTRRQRKARLRTRRSKA